MKRVQAIVGALLYYARAVNNRLLLGVSAIVSQQTATTEQNAAEIYQLLDYVATYPDGGIIYRYSDMIMAAQSDVGFDNKYKLCSCAGAQKFLLEEKPTPKWNGVFLTTAHIIKFVMSLAAEAELGVLYITDK